MLLLVHVVLTVPEGVKVGLGEPDDVIDRVPVGVDVPLEVLVAVPVPL